MSQTFYLKYRPQTISDLDSTLAKEELIKIFSSGKVPHAFLFSGTRGIGKTSAARIVAKAVNCENRLPTTDYSKDKSSSQKSVDSSLSFEPCNECDSCISITAGTSVDVLEIDAASNRGIDDIKELREKIRLAPSSSKYKVYIIDEVHMLTTEAFNALLKTLEEPPKHALFILCTTDPEKLPKTILSRCERINFKKATTSEIVSRLKKICEAEKLEFEEPGLKEIARLSDGSFRDAVKTLEQVSFSGKITKLEVEKTVGILGDFKIEDLLSLLKQKNTKEALLWIDKVTEAGSNLRLLLENILENLRGSLLQNFGVGEEKVLVEFSVLESKKLIALFTKAYFEMKNAIIPQLPLEMAIVEWDETQFKVQSAKFKVEDDGGKDSKKNNDENVILSKAKDPEEKNNPRRDSSPDVHRDQNDTVACSFSIEDVVSKWPDILEKVKPMNHSVLAFLKACRPKSCEEGYLVLEVFYKFHKDQLESDKCRKIFEKAASEVLGGDVKLRCHLGNDKPRLSDPVPLPPIEQKSTFAKASVDKQKSDEVDIIKLAEEIFNNSGTVH